MLKTFRNFNETKMSSISHIIYRYLNRYFDLNNRIGTSVNFARFQLRRTYNNIISVQYGRNVAVSAYTPLSCRPSPAVYINYFTWECVDLN